jgi:hypothetical protein
MAHGKGRVAWASLAGVSAWADRLRRNKGRARAERKRMVVSFGVVCLGRRDVGRPDRRDEAFVLPCLDYP